MSNTIENYFNYFTEIEEYFQRRRGTALLLSTLDWALIETWKEAGIPLAAALRGIDDAFDKFDRRPVKSRKVNSLAYCAQAVLTAAEEMKEAAVGATSAGNPGIAASGLGAAEIAAYIQKNCETIEQSHAPAESYAAVQNALASLRDVAEGLKTSVRAQPEEVERRLTVIEEKLLAALLASTSDDELLKVRAEADRDIAPYRSKMPAAQIDLLLRQYIHKRLLERYRLPRLSLFYMQ